MRKDAIKIFSNDLEADAKFYEEVLGFKQIFFDKENRCIGLDGRNCSFILEDGKSFPEMVGRFISLTFFSDNIKVECQDLKRKGVVFHSFPESMEDGCLMAHFNDLSGNTLTLVQEYL